MRFLWPHNHAQRTQRLVTSYINVPRLARALYHQSTKNIAVVTDTVLFLRASAIVCVALTLVDRNLAYFELVTILVTVGGSRCDEMTAVFLSLIRALSTVCTALV
jgi:hypothetical protein